MEELQAIETTTGRQFKPWVDADKLQQIVSDPASVTAVVSEITQGKKILAEAINAKGGSASTTESFQELADDIDTIPNAIDWVKMVCEREYDTNSIDNTNPIKSIERVTSNTTTFIGSYTFRNCTQLQYVDMPNVTSIGQYAFSGCGLKEINFPNVRSLNGYCFENNVSLTSVSFPKLTQGASRQFISCSALKTFYAPLMVSGDMAGSGGLEDVVVGAVNSTGFFSNRSIQSGSSTTLRRFKVVSSLTVSLNDLFYRAAVNLINLIDFDLPQDVDFNNNCSIWTASTYLTSTTADQWPNRLQLYTNLKEHLIDRLYDHSEDGVDTRVLRIGFYATLYADSQLVDEPYGSYYTPLIKAMAQACITTCGQKLWTISA